MTSEELDRNALRDLVRTDESGAVVIFEGIVRNHHEGHAVLHLEYEAYAPMAEKQMVVVAAEVMSDYSEHAATHSLCSAAPNRPHATQRCGSTASLTSAHSARTSTDASIRGLPASRPILGWTE